MPKRYEIYECEVCGNIVELLHGGQGELVCCGEPMILLEAKTKDKGKEKHVPVIERMEGGVKVRIGDDPHPMEEDHFIEWIAIYTEDGIQRTFLKPGDRPEAAFKTPAVDVKAAEHCSIHGLWRG